MVVDDDPTNNMICEFTIKRYNKNAEIKLFTKPEVALSSIKETYTGNKENQDTVLFLDLNMPTMSGWEFLDEFNLLDPAVKDQFTIYILSSSIEDFQEEAKLYPDLNGFLSKPLKLDYIEEVMNDLQNN
ncbi:response regulator [Salinimicrobium marinum]|uniref:Response regulator n=2 Tax=Salinimicrobium marinum TaxID=680283 RepID=A0A918SBU6_9FLAO|nr:response regulator [Salinimicrobium marinum]